MIAPAPYYTPDSKCIHILVDLRELAGCEFVHEQRGIQQQYSDLAGFGPYHMILILFHGAALELLR
jgi:hypothetical protein